MSHRGGWLRKYILMRKSLAVEYSVVKIYLIFSFLATGHGDVTYNPRRNFLGAMCVGGKIAYHLYNFGTSKSDGIVKLMRKSRWHSQYRTEASNYYNKFISHCRPILIYLYLDNHITSLDFSPNGETVATTDKYGVCLISDLSTNSYRFHLNMKMKKNDSKSYFWNI